MSMAYRQLHCALTISLPLFASSMCSAGEFSLLSSCAHQIGAPLSASNACISPGQPPNTFPPAAVTDKRVSPIGLSFACVFHINPPFNGSRQYSIPALSWAYSLSLYNAAEPRKPFLVMKRHLISPLRSRQKIPHCLGYPSSFVHMIVLSFHSNGSQN